jgi:inner membrane protein
METVLKTAWSKGKLLVKAFIIGMLVLFLLIPTFYVQDLIKEREDRQREAIAEVSSKWAGKQTVTGPVLVLPYSQNEGDSINRTKHLAYFLPDELTIQSSVVPQEKSRGIYKVMLYTTDTKLSGSFDSIDLEKLKIRPEDVLWNEAYVQISLSDPKGLNDEVRLNWNNQSLQVNQNTDESGSMISRLNAGSMEDFKQVNFTVDMKFGGSEQLLFTPVGKSTSVQLSSKWPHPSFTGDILPQTTLVKDSGFSASWKSLAFKRSFPQQWKGNAYVINPGGGTVVNSKDVQVSGTTYVIRESSGIPSQFATNDLQKSAFGSTLFVPVNGYQKTMRSIKYAVLCILLTFAAFFLIEVSHKKSVHPFQYGLIGLALVLFYTLLLSISEYTGFNIAYALASIATIGLITWFVKGILDSAKLSILLSVVLLLIYTYVFTILQLQDYSLILGSIGLFITLAVIMHFSKKIQW